MNKYRGLYQRIQRASYFPVLLVLMISFGPGVFQAAPTGTITVNSHLDTTGNVSICTLRDAILAANTNSVVGGCAAGSPYPSMDTINISFSLSFCELNKCTIILSGPLPAVSEDVTIQGVGSWTPTISGANLYRVFDLQAVVVNIANMNIIRGRAVGTSTAGYGGAINTSSSGTTLQVTNVGFFENHATSRGGAIQVSAGIIVIDNSTFSSNTVDYFGGAIGQYYGVLIITNNTISGNSALDGGSIEIQGSSETRLTNVTLSGNTAKGRGGGISRIGTAQLVSLNNVTITGNTADFDNNGSGD